MLAQHTKIFVKTADVKPAETPLQLQLRKIPMSPTSTNCFMFVSESRKNIVNKIALNRRGLRSFTNQDLPHNPYK